jgi:hypothetical protein
MRNLWHRLLIKLGIRKRTVWHGARAEVSIIGTDGKRVVLGVFKNVTYGPLPDHYDLGAKDVHILPDLDVDRVLLAGKQEFSMKCRVRTPEEAALFRERHCAVCLQTPSPCCGAERNTCHAEGCTHVCTHSYQRFAP